MNLLRQITLPGVILAVAGLCANGCSQMAMQRQQAAQASEIERLCRKGSEIAVHQNIALSAAEYEAAMHHKPEKESREDLFGSDYRYTSVGQFVGATDERGRPTNPHLYRMSETLTRVSDRKLLAEQASFKRIAISRKGERPYDISKRPKCAASRVNIGEAVFVRQLDLPGKSNLK